jgi:NAD(P)-dependent dehydrogenase (short-subunit alcohol dehydrogenase family)/SAM-dependent methyltransferase
LNPNITWDPRHFRVPAAPRQLTDAVDGKSLHVGVSGFGFSGTNAHLILGSAPDPIAPTVGPAEPGSADHVIAVSARSVPSLRTLVTDVIAYLESSDNVSLASISYTSTVRRALFRERICVVAATREQAALRLREALDAYSPAAGRKQIELCIAADDDIPALLTAFRSFGAHEEIEAAPAELEAGAQESLCERAHRVLMKCLSRLGVRPDRLIARGIGAPGPVYLLSDRSAILRALAACSCQGDDIRWPLVHSVAPGAAYAFPKYRFTRRTIRSSRIDQCLREHLDEEVRIHPLLVHRRAQPNALVSHRLDLSCAALDFLDQHRVRGRRLLPASLILDLMHRVARDAVTGPVGGLASVTFHQSVDCDRSGRTYLLQLDAHTKPAVVGLWSCQENGTVTSSWVCHASATVMVDGSFDSDPRIGNSQFTGEPLDVEELYTRHHANGVSLGEEFRCVRKLRLGDRSVYGEVSLAAGTRQDSVAVATIVLDGVFQTTAALRVDSSEILLLGSIGLVEIVGEAPGECRVEVHERRLEDSVEAGILRVDIDVTDVSGKRIWRFRDVAFRPARELPRIPRRNVESCYYAQRWVVQKPARRPQGGGDAPVAGVASPRDAFDGAQLLAGLSERAEHYRLEEYDRYRDRIEELCLAAIGTTLRSLGWPKDSGRAYSRQELLEQLQISATHRKLFNHFIAALLEGGVLRVAAEGEGVVLCGPLPDGVDFGPVGRDFADFRPETAFVQRCTTALGGVLRGAQDPLDVLFRNEALEGTEDIYLTSPISRVLNDQIARMVAELSERSSAPLRILEIGAGTGGTSRAVLPRLARDRIETYCFTDLSRSFLTRAKGLLGEFGFVEYRLLNIEEPLAGQGFAAGSFDVIIAANVLHATRSLGETLSHVVQLLSPRGHLILRECIKPQLSADVSFGMTQGWWRFEDTALRPAYPLLSSEKWLEVLSDSGFEDVRPMVPTARSAEAIIVARSSRRASGRRWLVVHTGQNAALGLTRRLSDGPDQLIELNLRAEQPESLSARLRATLDVEGSAPFDFVVCFPLVGPDELAGVDPTERTVELYERMIALCQTCMTAQATRHAKLWCVTTAAEKVVASDRLMGFAESVMAGVIKTVALEYPGRIGGVVDLECDDAAAADSLVDHFRRPARQHYVAIRNGEIYGARLEKLALQAAVPEPEAAAHLAGAVLITGGLGGLGFALAQKLAHRRGTTLILAGRDLDSESKRSRLLQLQGSAAEVIWYPVNVGEAGQVKRMFAELTARGVAVAHIVHAAGVGGDEALNEIVCGQHREITAPKIAGTWNLSRFSDPLAIRTFIVLSTMVALWGAKHKTHYVLANHFADRLVLHRRSQGLAGLSVQLGPVAGGMLSEDGKAVARNLGVEAFDADTIAEVLLRPLGDDVGEFALLDIEWARFKPHYEHTWLASFFDLITEAAPAGATASDRTARRPAGDIVRRYRDSSVASRDPFLRELIIEVLREVLGSAEAVGDLSHTGFHDMGMDSLLTLSFARALANRTGVVVSSYFPRISEGISGQFPPRQFLRCGGQTWCGASASINRSVSASQERRSFLSLR